MEDEVVESGWVSHLTQCPMCSFMVFQHQTGADRPKDLLKKLSDKLNEWKKEHDGKEWNGYDGDRMDKTINILIVPDGTYYRIEFWVDDWKFHSAKMPELQAEKLQNKFMVVKKE